MFPRCWECQHCYLTVGQVGTVFVLVRHAIESYYHCTPRRMFASLQLLHSTSLDLDLDLVRLNSSIEDYLTSFNFLVFDRRLAKQLLVFRRFRLSRHYY